MKNKLLLLTSIILIVLSGNLKAQDYKYIGAAKCKFCHNAPAKGEQYKLWAESKHAKSMETLKTDKAKQIADSLGIADASTDMKCIKCHATYASLESKQIETLTMADGVSCESCHGPGSVYKSATIMKSREKSIQNGLIIPDQATCEKCHNSESPTFTGFNFDEMWIKVNHPNPQNKK